MLLPLVRNQPFLRNIRRTFQVGKSPRRDEVFQIPIESLDKHGDGVTTIEWTTIQKQIEPTKVVVRGALPGETVRVRVVSVFAGGGSAIHTVVLNVFGRREHLIRPRENREPWRSSVEPELLPSDHTESKYFQPFDCPHFDRRHDESACSGCSVPHFNYTRQLVLKSKMLREALQGAVDDEVLANLSVQPRSQITRFSSRHEIFAFSKRPLEAPVWGQLSFKEPLPGERRDKHFVGTPECRIISKSAQTVLKRMEDLVAVAHSDNPELFSVRNAVINRGYLRSAIVQTSRDRDKKPQILLTIVIATKPSPRFRRAIKEKVADRLALEFPDLLKGVLLVGSRLNRDCDEQFFENSENVQVLTGEDFITQYIPALDRDVSVGPGTTLFDQEINEQLLPELAAAVGESGPNPEVLELYSGDGSVSKLLADTSASVTSMSERDVKLLIDEGLEPLESEEDELRVIPEAGTPLDSPPLVRWENSGLSTYHASPGKVDVAVISFPRNDGAKPEVKGVTPKKFRHWLGNVVRPNKVVICTDKSDGLRKDIGHLRLMGYELQNIKAWDGQPGTMDKIVSLVVMTKKPGYQPLSPEQLIE